MMMQPDNNNLEFTFGVVRWLVDDGKRPEVLLMENGTIHSSFDVTLTRIPLPPIPPIESLLPIISRRVAALERENVVNRMIQQSVEHSTIMRFTMLALTLGLLAYGAFRFLNIRQRFDPRPKKAATLIETESNWNEAASELRSPLFLTWARTRRPPALSRCSRSAEAGPNRARGENGFATCGMSPLATCRRSRATNCAISMPN